MYVIVYVMRVYVTYICVYVIGYVNMYVCNSVRRCIHSVKIDLTYFTKLILKFILQRKV